MKRFIRIIAAAVCAATLGLSLCSCTILDDAKKSTAVYTDDSKTGFTFRGGTYKEFDNIYLKNGIRFIMSDTAYGYHITTKDVPVLLSSSYGKMMIFNRNEDSPVVIGVMRGYADEDSWIFSDYYSDDQLVYYVREDKYDEVRKLINDAVIDSFYASFYVYEDKDNPWNGGYNKNIVIDDKAAKAVNNTLKNGNQFKWSEIEDDQWDSMDIYSCDKDLLVTDARSYSIIVTEGYGYYINDTSDLADSSVLYKVSQEDYSAIDKLYKEYEESNYFDYPEEVWDNGDNSENSEDDSDDLSAVTL